MEIKINKEIRNYNEKIYFGLTLREFICSIIACILAVILYTLLKPYLGTEVVSWICMICSVPFVFLGFVKYNGMKAENLLLAFIKSKLLIPKKLCFKPNNNYQMYINHIKDGK